MARLNLAEYEQKVEIRPLRIEDFPDLIALQRLCFPNMGVWKREQIESQLRVFPEGQICVTIGGELAASSSSLIVTYDPDFAWHDWRQVSDGGYIRNHEPEGDTLYGIEIMVHPGFRGQKLSRRLYDARKALARERNLSQIIIAGRIPG